LRRLLSEFFYADALEVVSGERVIDILDGA